jgi:predicted ATPase
VRYGLDTKAYAKMLLAFDLTFLGHCERALQEAEEALDWARKTDHAATIALALLYVAMVRAMRWEPEQAAEVAAQGLAFAGERGLPAQQAYCGLLHAWGTNNREAMIQTIGLLEMMNSELGLPFYRTLLASLEAARGAYGEALQWLDRALARSQQTGDVYFVAGILVFKGRILLKQNPKDAELAERLLSEALDLARQQKARAFELSATTALSRILIERGETAQAQSLLEAILASFTEGSTTASLKEARHLLERLAAVATTQ